METDRIYKEKIELTRIVALNKKAKVCIVSPLQDGLNIVCKEFIASQELDCPGVLLLSEFAGAAEELNGSAILINPYDIENFTDSIKLLWRWTLKRKETGWRSSRKRWKKMIYSSGPVAYLKVSGK
jgi:Trehalose-6-phosphate synthase